MVVPKGITCMCGRTATRVHNLAKGARIFGLVYSCDICTPALTNAEIHIEWGRAIES